MKEQILSDLEKFTNIQNNINKQFMTLVLTDIIANLSTSKEEGNTKDYQEFDELVSNIKNFLNNMPYSKEDIPDIIDSTQQSLEDIKKMKSECLYSIRTLTWVKDLLEEGDKDKDA